MSVVAVEHRTSVNDLVNRALAGWMGMTGLVMKRDGRNPKSIATSCPWQAWDVVRHTEELNKSRTLDPTGLTTFMLLRGLVESYLNDVKINATTSGVWSPTFSGSLATRRSAMACRRARSSTLSIGSSTKRSTISRTSGVTRS